MAECDSPKKITRAQTAVNYLFAHGYIEKERIEFSENVYSRVFENASSAVILDFNLTLPAKNPFPYSIYTNTQNTLVMNHKKVYRFLSSEKTETIGQFLRAEETPLEFSEKRSSVRPPDNTPVEHFFEERFAEVYGWNNAAYLQKEFPVPSLNGSSLFLDFYLEKKNGDKIAVEENGVTYHHPQLIGEERYKHQIEKQNICAALGIKVYRLSSEDCVSKETAREDIQNFFGSAEDFLIRGITAERPFALYEHQEKAVAELRLLHAKKNFSALFVFPTGSGKTQIVLEDLSFYLSEHPAAKILIASPTVAVTENWKKETAHLNNAGNIECGTYHTLWKMRGTADARHYDYIVADEAHHAVAPMIKNALTYFVPHALVGLTATPDRPDKKKLSEVFGTYETQLSLQDAIKKNIVCDVRCFRIETNLDLSSVRVNGREFVNADLEKTIRIDSRNELIAEVLQNYFGSTAQKGIIFCVSVAHTKTVAETLNRHGLSAADISSKSKNKEQILHDFHEGNIRFLCACDLLNEGWNEPELEIIVMARPTLSKVLYLQQLGRGLRRTKSKKEVFVLDVVDSYGSVATPWSCHAVFENAFYVPFGSLTKKYSAGDIIEVNGLYETIQAVVPVNISTFETLYDGYLSAEQSARELFIGTETFNSWICKKEIIPDVTIPFGTKQNYLFSPETLEKIRQQKKLGIHNDETIKSDFFNFIGQKDYTYSFKIIFLQGVLTLADNAGRVNLDELQAFYTNFYLNRITANLIVDKKGCVYTKEYLSDSVKMKRSILQNPFEKFERKRFVFYSKDLNEIEINHALFRVLTTEDKAVILQILKQHLAEYYQKLGSTAGVEYKIPHKETQMLKVAEPGEKQ